MSAHTPGPWKAVLLDKWKGYRIEGPNGEPIAEDGYGPRGANARLIAAAPRMLDTLKAIRDSYLDETTHYEQLVALMRATANTVIKEIEG